jgi:cytochrome P450
LSDITDAATADVGGCPVAHGYDPLDPATLTNPFPQIAALRSDAPVAHMPSYDHYVVLKYDDIERMLFDRDSWSASNASSPLIPVCPAAQEVLNTGFKRVPTLNNADAPRHGPMRRAVFRCMTPARLNALEPMLREYCRELVLAIKDEPVVELVDKLTFPFPGYAAFSLLGFPASDTEQLRKWSSTRVMLTYGRLTDDQQVEVARDIVAFWRYCEAFVTSRMTDPVDDLTSDLGRYAAEHPDEVTEFDIVNMVYSMALAGHETTTNATGNGLRAILPLRDQWQMLIDQPELIPNAVEEMLRFDSPVFLHRRLAKCEVQFGDATIPEGGKVFMGLSPAGRDPEHFADPDTFDVLRDNAKDQLAFGKGAHLCLGAPLARLEMRIVFELLGEYTPNMELVPEQPFEYVPNALFRGLTELHVAPKGLAAAGLAAPASS